MRKCFLMCLRFSGLLHLLISGNVCQQFKHRMLVMSLVDIFSVFLKCVVVGIHINFGFSAAFSVLFRKSFLAASLLVI